MNALLGLLVITACGLCFGTGLLIGRHISKPRSEAIIPRKKRLVRLGTMKVGEAMAMAIPSHELFLQEKTYTDRMPDEIWLAWPPGRSATVYWLTDRDIP